MANRKWEDIQTLGQGHIVLEGRLAMSAGPTITRAEGVGFEAAIAGVGDYTVTPTDIDGSVMPFEALVSCTVTIGRGAAAFVDDDVAEYFFDAAAGVLHLLVYDISAGALDDIAAGSEVSFRACFRNSTVTT